MLVARSLAASRTVAQALILEGKVRVGGQTETKAGRMVTDDAEIEVEAPPRFVSRGGEKLEGAVVAFPGWWTDWSASTWGAPRAASRTASCSTAPCA